jgi:CubicO group peptidase (beta-lactamase class C family)
MVEEGIVTVDDPVQRYLPAGVELPLRGRPITLADLATQTSGLPRLPPGLLRRSLLQRRNPYARFTEADLEQAIPRARLKSSPGERLRYSNFGFGLLGYAHARRAGQPFEQLVRERVCDPLGLADTQIAIPDEAHTRFAERHNRHGKHVPHWDLAALAGAGRFVPQWQTCSASSSCSFSRRRRGLGERRKRRMSQERIVEGSPKASAGQACRFAATRVRCSGTTAAQAASAASSASSTRAGPAWLSSPIARARSMRSASEFSKQSAGHNCLALHPLCPPFVHEGSAEVRQD